MPDLAAAAIAANRFGFGVRPGELRGIASDPRGWIKEQFAAEAPAPPQIAALPAGEDDLLAFGRWLAARRLRSGNAQAVERRAARQGVSEQELRALSVEDDFIQNFRSRAAAAIDARLLAACTSAAPARERLVHFWSNHFTVSAAKPAAVALPPSFEREAIRPHAAGRFSHLLRASSQHPGMLAYLDNWLSIGPNSPAAGRPRLRGQRGSSGLNENLAREILELHTLGVNGGYAQTDVQALAAIISGWTYARPRLVDYVRDQPGTRSAAGLFRFEASAHEPGAQTLLGRVYRQDGLAQGEQALDDLASRPATARFIATKLARHYIADDPPQASVDRIAAAFIRSDGDIKFAMNAVVDSPEVWDAPFKKFKRPEEYLISVLRAANVQYLPQGAGAAAVGAMGQRIYAAPAPDGWSDREATWLSADLVWKRIEFAQTFASRIMRRGLDPLDLGEAVLGPLFSADTRESIRQAESGTQGLAILLAAPEFQRR